MPKKEAYYFSHDSNARNDPKQLKLRARLKMEGYGVYWCIIEMLRDQKDYKLPTDYEAISFGLNVDCELVERVINEFDLFVISGEKFYSESLIRRMEERSIRSQKASDSAKARWEKRNEKQSNKEGNPEPIKPKIPENNTYNKLGFEDIKVSFEKQKGLNKPYFYRMQELHNLPEKEVLSEFERWKLKNESNAFSIKHAENSFNIWIGHYKENKNGTTKNGKEPKKNGSKQLSSIYAKISGIHRE